MVNAELVTSIKNALERKQSLESAVESLVNAGYFRQEVDEAAKQATLAASELQTPTTVSKPIKPKKGKILAIIIILCAIAIGICAYVIIKFI